MAELTEYSFILAPSTATGIGVFSTRDISAGTHLFTAKIQTRTLKITDVPPPFVKYCIFIDDENCKCPERFDRMEIGWYINHSFQPNIGRNSAGIITALRDILANEEIVIDYNELNEPEYMKESYYQKTRGN